MDTQPSVKSAPWGSRVLCWLATLIYRILGWRLDAPLPDLPKYVIIVAPHTSNWDGIVGVTGAVIVTRGFADLRISWLAKRSLFAGPLKGPMMALGGVQIDRSARHAVVDQAVQEFERRDQMVLAITPEGSRRRMPYWKTGFYYIALGAHVPILLAYVDYRRKVVGTGPLVTPSGDIQADMAIIREFYSHITARYPANVGEVRVAPPDREPAHHAPQ
jgi:1-acyl-sn-glycerol-3-phosphate acyltransferase